MDCLGIKADLSVLFKPNAYDDRVESGELCEETVCFQPEPFYDDDEEDPPEAAPKRPAAMETSCSQCGQLCGSAVALATHVADLHEGKLKMRQIIKQILFVITKLTNNFLATKNSTDRIVERKVFISRTSLEQT